MSARAIGVVLFGLLISTTALFQVSAEGGKKDATLTLTLLANDGKSEAITQSIKKVEDILGIKVQMNVVPDDQGLNMVRTKIVTGNADDIIVHPWGAFELPVDLLAPLDGPWTAKIADATRPFCLSYKDSTKIIKAPFGGQSNFGFIYNKEILKKAGVKLPMRNFKELSAACEAVKKLGVTPILLSNKENWTAQVLFLSSQTGIFMNDLGLVQKIAENKIKPADIPALVKHWENGKALLTKGYINSDYMSTTHPMAMQEMAEGKAAFYCSLDSFYGDLAKDYPEQVKNLGMTNTPLWDDEKYAMVMTNPSGLFFSVPANGKNVALAKQFIDTFLSQEVMTLYYSLKPGMAPFKDLGYELSQSPWNKEMGEYGKTIKQYGDWTNSLYGGKPTLNSFWGDFNLQAQGLFAGKSAQDSLKAWYTKYAIDAKAKKFPGF
jgi:raffinose/stachyose/melibiose transport system substrate-binding protein